MADLTVIYYTCNQEAECFESAIRATLVRHAADVPIISVSQKPIDLGTNICVGGIGVSHINSLKQIVIGAEAATTKYVSLAEADCLFPPGYFSFVPEYDGAWAYPAEGYVIWQGHSTFWRKYFRELVGTTSREHLLRTLPPIIDEAPQYISNAILKRTRREVFNTSAPVVTIKTKRGMHRASPRTRRYKRELPLWGTASDLWRAYPCA